MKNLSIGIQTFSELIEKECVYVDKTGLIYELITKGKCYFLSRPRRFGKSLLVSTLAAIFAGKRELFKGLVIDSLSYDWKHHPVIMISFSDIPYTSPDTLEQGLRKYLQVIAKGYDVVLDGESSAGEMLRELVMCLARNGKVALLIDEYDYPILQHLHNVMVAQHMREILKSFYAVIKGLDQYLAFVFLTGVSKFSKTSIFSGLNNAQDISLDYRYNTLLGYTQEEIIIYLESYVEKIVSEQSYPREQLLADIKLWYDGYQFTKKEKATKVYNPFSVLLFLNTGEFNNYWFETGTPIFLMNVLKDKGYPVLEFEGVQASESELGEFEIDDIDLKTLLFQTGYMTIKEYDPTTRNYILGYPNKNIRESFN